jgi:hypothetical protein
MARVPVWHRQASLEFEPISIKAFQHTLLLWIFDPQYFTKSILRADVQNADDLRLDATWTASHYQMNTHRILTPRIHRQNSTMAQAIKVTMDQDSLQWQCQVEHEFLGTLPNVDGSEIDPLMEVVELQPASIDDEQPSANSSEPTIQRSTGREFEKGTIPTSSQLPFFHPKVSRYKVVCESNKDKTLLEIWAIPALDVDPLDSRNVSRDFRLITLYIYEIGACSYAHELILWARLKKKLNSLFLYLFCC